MAMQRVLLSLPVMAAMLIQLAMAATYTVGGANGAWDQITDLQTWVSSQTFLVGDSLSFQYSPNHNVIEVPKSDYDACQPSNLIQVYNDGSSVIPLTSPGKRYFICGTSGHCSSGMKLEITTLAATPSTPSTPKPSSPPTTSTPKPSSPPTPPSPAADAPDAEPTAAPPSTYSDDSPMENGTPLSLSPSAPSTGSHLSAPAPISAAPATYATSFRAGLLMGFGALVLLLAF
ncbi:uclacyanin 1-like [Humulus lupulus]|uniref:uclacyanin 1-like n=1 Tax=Humulus lupulus TaxID=3486 RepID=UPI002B40488C|nr:uclacyanin 1-like [Humulus lupulus]